MGSSAAADGEILVDVCIDADSDARAVSRSRRLVAATLSGAEPSLRALQTDVTLVAGELLTNALLHGAAPVTLRLLTAHGGLRLEVADASPVAPLRGRAGAESLTGRGILILDQVATRWGTTAEGGGKVIWAEFAAAGAAAAPRRGYRDDGAAELGPTPVDQVPEPAGARIDAADPARARAEGRPPQRFRVRLGDVPTDLLLAAKGHVDNLVREFTLASRGAASGETAAVSPRLTELISVVATTFVEPRQAIRRQALTAAASGRPRTSLELVLPVSAADAAEEYLAAIDRADEYARAARLLTVETPPTHRAFRHWYISSLVTQLRAAGRGEQPPVTPTFEEFLLGALTEASAARRAAERGSSLQVVTAALASTTRPEQVAEVVLAEGVAALGASGGSLLVPQGPELLAVPGAVGYPQELVAQLRAERRDAALPAAEAIREGEAVWLESVHETRDRFPLLRELEPGTVSLCALPLSAGGEVLGALRFSFDYPRLFGPQDRLFAETLAAQCALALERARLFAAERAARARMSFLATATERLTARLDEDETLRQLVRLVVPDLADYAAVYLHEPDKEAWLAAETGSGAGGDEPRPLDPRQTPAMRLVARRGTSFGGPATTSPPSAPLSAQPFALTGELAAVPSAAPPGVLAVPLRIGGATVAVLGLRRSAGFPADDVSLVGDVADRASVALAHARQYQQERQTALTLQRILLPQRLPRVDGVEFAWRYLPAGAGSLVGGDWYDVLTPEDGTIALVIGDVMGRGIQAAATMGQLRAFARANAAAGLPAETVLVQLDAAVSRLEQEQITTVAMAVLDPVARELRVASAGHLPPLVVPPHGGEPSFVTVEPGPPLGAGAAGTSYSETVVPFAAGSILLLYTDGLVEDRDRSVDDGMALLRGAAAGATGPEDLCERALAALARGSHDDDTALLAVSLTA
ncbi:SpoIIE family protein phosphatase [Frankia sp. AgB1.9]|uniref:SpoIIE family protein phosphatase n=1 Tax=unclassified Frankia TaxID=2632575 RepID=UPI00193488C0|nr:MULTISPECIES: SpoIIE family protein phosphatase [unclassified Frankia]MBL7492174.1 SpoIIE family protein phosphatase [Frankia sp. AgW1.1]MBL7552114.1 SpoIIE family protein phosphatase [Frankia sp. AgB1.9]MBL7622167.1 SpoIIE family protein phosphatase [Frankia sp. AgB1.8]